MRTIRSPQKLIKDTCLHMIFQIQNQILSSVRKSIIQFNLMNLKMMKISHLIGLKIEEILLKLKLMSL